MKDTRPWAKMFVAGAAAVTLSVAIFASAFAASSSTVVTEMKREGWVFNPDLTTSTPYEFNEDAASVGDGSLYVFPIQNDPNTGNATGERDKFIASLPVNYSSDQFDAVSFDFQLGEGVDPARADQVYLNVYTNLPGSSTFYDCRFDQVATIGSSAEFNTVIFNSDTEPTNVASRGGAVCPTNLSDLPAGSVVKGLTLNLGDTSLNDNNVSAYFDNVVVSAAGNVMSYNFEQSLPTATSKEDCKNNGWMILERDDDTAFKNQGQCVAYVQSSDNSKHRR